MCVQLTQQLRTEPRAAVRLKPKVECAKSPSNAQWLRLRSQHLSSPGACPGGLVFQNRIAPALGRSSVTRRSPHDRADPTGTSSPCDTSETLKMLPQIRRRACFAFRGLPRERREDLVAEVVASSFCAWARLASQEKEHVASPTTLAQYAIRQVRAWCRVGTRLRRCDVMSEYARRFGHSSVERLDRFDREPGACEILVEDRTAGPAEIAAWRGSISAPGLLARSPIVTAASPRAWLRASRPALLPKSSA